MKSTFQIDVLPYPSSMFVCVGYKDNEFKEIVDKLIGEEEAAKKKHKRYEKLKDAEAYVLNFDNGVTVLRLRQISKKYQDLGIVCHEVYHAVCYIMRYSGIKPTKGSEEAYAYLMQHIIEQIYSKLFKK